MSRSSAERGSDQGAMGRVREVDYAGLRLDSFVCACVVSVGVNPCNVCVIEHRLDFDCLTVPLLHANFTPQATESRPVTIGTQHRGSKIPLPVSNQEWETGNWGGLIQGDGV